MSQPQFNYRAPSRRRQVALVVGQTFLPASLILLAIWQDAHATLLLWLSFFTLILSLFKRLRLLRQMQEAEEYVAKQNAVLLESQSRLKLLNTIAAGVSAGMSVEQVIEHTVTQTHKYFPELRIAYATVNEGRQLAVLYSLEPLGTPPVKGFEADLSVVPEYLNTLMEGGLVVVEDVNRDPRFAPLASTMVANSIRAVLGTSFYHQNKLIGILCFSSSQPHKWSEHEIATLQEVAEYLSIALREAYIEQKRKQAEEALRNSERRLREVNAKLAALATTDGLTGLKNHRAFQERLEEEFKRAVRYNTPLSLLLLDVDKFKKYNDTFGHPAGDEVLKTIAQLLIENARETDFIARYGGDEFVMILSNTDCKGAIALAKRLQGAFEQYSWVKRSVTASFGISTLSSTTPNRAALIEQADEALYRSKKGGRNRVTHISVPEFQSAKGPEG